MEKHITLLGILFICYHVMVLFGAFIVILTFMGLGIWGHTTMHAVDFSIPRMPFSMLTILGFSISGFLLLISLPGLIAGAGLLRFKSWSRILALIVAAFNLLTFPFGTALAIYAFWVLLSSESAELLK